MIKLRNLISEMISEKLSYSDLMKSSDVERVQKSKNIPAKSLVVNSVNDRESWKFSYKSPKTQNTTDTRHQGFIYFFKESLTPGDNAFDIDCSVDCSCQDYKYRWAYNNARAGAGELGGNSLNRSNGAAPRINLGIGLCKHLLSLKEYLKTKIDSVPNDPQEPGPAEKPIAVPKTPSPSQMPPEEPEEPVDPEQPLDPTQTPDVNIPQEPEQEPPQTNIDPTQTPQEPDQLPTDEEEPPLDNKNQKEKKPKLKEGINKNIYKVLDEICRSQRVFIIEYYD